VRSPAYRTRVHGSGLESGDSDMDSESRYCALVYICCFKWGRMECEKDQCVAKDESAEKD